MRFWQFFKSNCFIFGSLYLTAFEANLVKLVTTSHFFFCSENRAIACRTFWGFWYFEWHFDTKKYVFLRIFSGEPVMLTKLYKLASYVSLLLLLGFRTLGKEAWPSWVLSSSEWVRLADLFRIFFKKNPVPRKKRKDFLPICVELGKTVKFFLLNYVIQSFQVVLSR